MALRRSGGVEGRRDPRCCPEPAAVPSFESPPTAAVSLSWPSPTPANSLRCQNSSILHPVHPNPPTAKL